MGLPYALVINQSINKSVFLKCMYTHRQIYFYVQYCTAQYSNRKGVAQVEIYLIYEGTVLGRET
jgi:hypothetical protein